MADKWFRINQGLSHFTKEIMFYLWPFHPHREKWQFFVHVHRIFSLPHSYHLLFGTCIAEIFTITYTRSPKTIFPPPICAASTSDGATTSRKFTSWAPLCVCVWLDAQQNTGVSFTWLPKPIAFHFPVNEDLCFSPLPFLSFINYILHIFFRTFV